MTLLLAAGNRRYAILVADRRFTENGRLVDADDDDRNKLVLLQSRGVKMAAAFTGMARVGSFETDKTLADAMHRSIELSGGRVDLQAIADGMTEAFGRVVAPNAKKVCFVLMVGFHAAGPDQIEPFYVHLSNAYRAGQSGLRSGPFQFELWEPLAVPDASYAISSHPGVTAKAQVDRLVQLAAREIPPHGLIGLAVQSVRDVSVDVATGGTVGAQCSSALVWADPMKNPEFDYHPTHSVAAFPTPLLVSPRGVVAYRFEGVGSAARFASRHKRAPCECASGKRWGDCHMRQRNRIPAAIAG